MILSEGRTMKWSAAVGPAARLTLAAFAALAISAWSPDAAAQSAPPQDSTWQAVTTITAVSALATELVMPRVFYTGSDSELTVGWKSRFHVLVLAPTVVLTGLTILNEYALKSAIGTKGPCSAAVGSNPPVCDGNETLSTQSFAGFSAFGQGAGIFVVDTIKWSDGKINVGSLVGNVVLPLALASVTAGGRVAGNWEDTGSVLLSSGVGLVIGAVTGVVYAMLVRPGCGYSGDLLCW